MAVKTAVPKPTQPLVPPEESMWQKHSPHYELPLAGATSLFLHGAIVGGLVIASMAVFWAASQEAAKPPKMDVVMLDGDGGGLEGSSGESGLPGAANAGKGKTEVVPETSAASAPERKNSLLPPENPPQLGIPMIDDGQTPLTSDLTIELAQIAEAADTQVKKAMNIPPTPPASPNTKKPGTGNPKGVDGKGGIGSGTGSGGKKGAGMGRGGPGGRPATKQDVYAARWHFDISGDAKEHARKLAAMGVTLAFPDPKGGFVVVKDLNRRPVDPKKENLLAYKDVVKWYNTRRESVQALANELQLGFTPEYVVLLLPKEREEKMANEEARYAAANRRSPQVIRKTWFDFRLSNGAYDPTVIRQD